MTTPAEQLRQVPAPVRLWAYRAYAVLVLIAGAIAVGCASADVGAPVWLDVATDVLAYLGAALGLTAAANVDRGPS